MTDSSRVPDSSENFLWLAERQPTGFLAALWLDSETADKLALSSGESADSLHVTLAYVSDSDSIDELTQARTIAAIYDTVKYTSQLEGTIAGYGRFKSSESSDNQDVFYLTPDIPRLFDVRHQIVECLRYNGLTVSEAHGYSPHITLSYIDAESENPDYEIPDLTLKFSSVTVMSGTRRVDIPLWVPELEPTISMSEKGNLPLDAILGAQPARPLYFGSFDNEWIPFLPKPGVYNHEVFGSMDLTSDAYDQMLGNFNSYVFKQDLPIRATHTPADNGAIGWIKPGGMRLASDGSLEVKPEWNELGKGLVDGDRFRYVSAEFMRNWKNPVTEETFQNVAVGLALVTSPHFKTDVLNPLSASEAFAFSEFSEKEGSVGTENPAEAEKGTEVTVDVTTPPVATPPVATPPVVAPPTATAELVLSDLTQVVLSAEQRQKERLMFSDLTTRVELAERRASIAETELKKIGTERRVEKFTAEVIGRSAENGQAWFGDPKANVNHLVSLSETYGDDSPEVRWAITQKRNEAKAIHATGIFDPIAIGATESGASADAQIMRLAEQYRQSDKDLTMEAAISKAYDEHPDLYIASLKK